VGPRSQEERRQAAEARALAAETALAAIGAMVDASELQTVALANQFDANNELETIASELEALAAKWKSPHTGETTTRPPSPV
jgi:hypothetical protein